VCVCVCVAMVPSRGHCERRIVAAVGIVDSARARARGIGGFDFLLDPFRGPPKPFRSVFGAGLEHGWFGEPRQQLDETIGQIVVVVRDVVVHAERFQTVLGWWWWLCTVVVACDDGGSVPSDTRHDTTKI